MSYIEGVDRGQTQLLPPSVEDCVAADAPVRVIDAFVAGLDLAALGFARAEPAAARPARYCTAATPPKTKAKCHARGYKTARSEDLAAGENFGGAGLA